MDLYDHKAIIEASTLYDSAIDKQNYFIESLETAKQHYESNENKDIEYYYNEKNPTLKINGFEVNIFKEATNRPKTHGEYYKYIFEGFTEIIKQRINSLDWDVMNENELLQCELKPTLPEKYFCFSKLKTYYSDKLNENELFFKNDKPEIYNNYKKEYTEQLEKIENRLHELKEQNSKPQQTVNSVQDYSLQCDYSENKIQSDLYPLFNKVFDCTKEQITNLLSESISTQITAKNGFTLKDIVYFVWWLKEKNHIKSVQYGNVIDKTKCIKWNGKPITATQIKKTKDTFKTSLPSIEISNILD